MDSGKVGLGRRWVCEDELDVAEEEREIGVLVVDVVEAEAFLVRLRVRFLAQVNVQVDPARHAGLTRQVVHGGSRRSRLARQHGLDASIHARDDRMLTDQARRFRIEQVAALQAEVGKMQWERGLTDLRADALKVIRSPEFKAWAVKFYEGATAGQRAVFDSNDPKDSLRIIDEFEQATGVTAKREAAKRQASKASLHSVGQPGGRGPAPGAARTVDEIWDKIPEDELD